MTVVIYFKKHILALYMEQIKMLKEDLKPVLQIAL